MPKRIQRKCTKGWRMPHAAVYVGRPTKWGNPWRLVRVDHHELGTTYRLEHQDGRQHEGGALYYEREAVWWAARLFGETEIWPSPASRDAARRELAGMDLACWCPLGQPCHADVLLKVANADEGAW